MRMSPAYNAEYGTEYRIPTKILGFESDHEYRQWIDDNIICQHQKTTAREFWFLIYSLKVEVITNSNFLVNRTQADSILPYFQAIVK